jgi:predicted kinase
MLEVLMGIPASGKSTWAARHAAGTILTADAIRTAGHDGAAALAYVQHQAAQLLQAGHPVTIDACSTQAPRRAAWLAIAAQHGQPTRLVIVAVPGPVAQARNAARPRAQRVPWPALQQYVRSWPGAVAQARSEAWGEIIEVAS